MLSQRHHLPAELSAASHLQAVAVAPISGVATAHLDAMLGGIGFGLLSFDHHLGVIVRNACLADVLEIPRAVLARADTLIQVLEACPVLDASGAQSVLEACLAAVASGDTHHVALTVPSADGARMVTVQVRRLEDGHWMAAFEDTTARHLAEATAIEAARSDTLTGLPGREQFERGVMERLAQGEAAGPTADGLQECGSRPDAAVMMIDLDRFKLVNDTLGHPIGDALLRLVGKRLRSLVRRDDLVARLGGDEFAVLVQLAPADDGMIELGRRIVDVLSRPYLVSGHLVNIGASVGVAMAQRDGDTYEELMRAADLALYEAKNTGRGACRFFNFEMGDRAISRRLIEIDLRKAMALQQFELYYQPQFNLDTHTIEGFEALLRWRHPERGLIPPRDFISLAEEIGMIIPLGEWVIREACEEAARWPASIIVAVNVSPQQFEDPDRLVDMVRNTLSAAGLPGSRLEVEITEGVLLRNEPAVLTALHRLRDMKVQVAMDDFGTGYSSLSQLNTFPFDKIKIDRSFVSGSSNIDGQSAIVRAITALGTSLGMATIAEGVETPEQLARIRGEGCSSVQGYLFSRPVPVDQVAGLIAQFMQIDAVPPQPVTIEGPP